MDLRKKLKITFYFFTFFYGSILMKAFYLQVYKKKDLTQYAHQQIVREVKYFPPRGLIYDRDGHLLAMNIKSYNIFLIPKKNDLFLDSLKKASLVLNLDFKKFKKEIETRKKYTFLARSILLKDKEKEELKKLEGIYLEETWKRYYPYENLFSKGLGTVGQDAQGLAGLEYFFEENLKGVPSSFTYYKDAKGRAIKIQERGKGQEPESLELSLSKEMQEQLEQILNKALKESKSIAAGGAIVDVYTGEILALAHLPDFNPNLRNFSERWNLNLMTEPIEPGSILKPFIIALGLNEGLISPETEIFCENGFYLIDQHKIKEAQFQKFQWLSVSDILKKSSNIGMVKIGQRFNQKDLVKKLSLFGFFEKTGIELSGESKGLKPSREGSLELATLTFGQGLALTPLQVIRGFLVFATNGLLPELTLLKNKRKPFKRVLSKEIASKMNELLERVTLEGTGRSAQMKYVTIAGKTSTAQKSKNGQYSGYVSSFIGYSTNTQERFLIYVYLDEPQVKNYFGGKLAAPVFKEIAEYLFLQEPKNKYLSLLDQKTFLPTSTKSLKGLTQQEALKINPHLIFEGSQGVIYKEERLAKGQLKVYLGDPFYDD